MARDNGLNVRAAGAQIVAAGLDNAVVRRDEGDITTHRGRQQESDDADKPARKPQREERREDRDRGNTREDRRKRRESAADEGENEADPGEDDENEAETGDSHTSDREEDDHEDATDDGEAEGEEFDDDDNEDEGSSRRDEDLDRKFTVKVNGKETPVTARELIAGYQRGRDYAEKTTALAQRGRMLDQGHGEVAEVYKAQLNRAAFVVKNVRQMLAGDLDSAEMRQLLATNPQQWSVQRQLMQDRLQGVDGVLQSIYQQYERHEADFKANAKKNLATRALHEVELIMAAVPDWNDAPNGGVPAKIKLGEYLNKSGFTPDELKDVVDSRMLIIANKARLWDEQQQRRAQPVKKQPKPAPRIARPTGASSYARSDQQPSQTRQYQSAKAKAKKTGDMRDAGDAINLLLTRRENRGSRR